MSWPLAAGHQARAFTFGHFDVLQVGVPLLFIYRWTHIHGFVQPRPNFDFLRLIYQPLQQTFLDLWMSNHPRGRGAALTGRAERAAVNSRSCFVQVGIGHDDDRIFAAHLAGHFDAALRCFNIQRIAHRVRAGKRDCPDSRVVDNGLAHHRAGTNDHVEHARRQPGLFVNFGQE